MRKIVTAALALALLIPSLAQAEGDTDTRWVWRTIKQQYRTCDWTGQCYHAWRYVRVRQYQSQVYSYVQRDRDRDYDRADRDRPQCVGRDIDVLSTEHTNEDNARDAATKLWMAKTQWEWGSQYMSLDNATHVRWRCSPSNAHDTVSGRIAEGAAKLVGRDGQNSRCFLSARPCRSALEKDRGARR